MPEEKKDNAVVSFVKGNKKLIAGIIIAIIIIILWNKHGYLILRFFKPDVQNNAPEPLSDVRKFQIEEQMKKIKTDIYDTNFWGGHIYGLYEQLLGWYDDEIKYAADYYKNFLASGNSLHSDLDSQWFLWSDVKDKVMNKLSELGKT